MDEGDGGMPGVAMMPEIELAEMPATDLVLSDTLATNLVADFDNGLNFLPENEIKSLIEDLYIGSSLVAVVSFVGGLTYISKYISDPVFAILSTLGMIVVLVLWLSLSIFLMKPFVTYSVKRGWIKRKKPITANELIARHQREIEKIKAPWLDSDSEFNKILFALDARKMAWTNRLDEACALRDDSVKLDEDWQRVVNESIEENQENVTALENTITRLKRWRADMLTAIRKSTPSLSELELKISILSHREQGRKLSEETRVDLERMARVVATESRDTLERLRRIGGKVEVMGVVLSAFTEPNRLLADVDMYRAIEEINLNIESNGVLEHEEVVPV